MARGSHSGNLAASARYELQRFLRDFSRDTGLVGHHVPSFQPRTPSGLQQGKQSHTSGPTGSGPFTRCWHHTSSACGPPSTSSSWRIPAFAVLPGMRQRGQELVGRMGQMLQHEARRVVTPWAYEGHRGFAAGRIRKQANIAEKLRQAWRRAQERGANALPPVVAREAQRSLHWWQAYWASMPSVTAYVPHFTPPPLPALPSWVRARLPHWPEGWSSPSAWLPYDWATRPGFEARVAILNAIYTMGGHVQRLIPVLITEAVRRDRYSYAYALSGPPQTPAVLLPVEEVPWSSRGPVTHAIAATLEGLFDVARAVFLLLLFSPLLVTAPICIGHDWHREWWMRRLRETLEAAGPAFIKWGQWAATRADMFPPDMCRQLERLHTRAPAHALPFTEKVIQSAFGAPISLLFDTFGEEPVASGSIGQVYRATLSETGASSTGMNPGTQVAVKVRHPGVGQAIQRDFALMLRMARLLEYFPAAKALRLEDSLKQFAAPLREQVDLALEARHLWQFNYNFRKNKLVRFPFPIYPLVAPEVLVETFEDGEVISRYVELGPGAPYNTRLAKLGSQTMLQMMLVDNLIHSDLHPGNILVAVEPPRGPFNLLRKALDVVAPLGVHLPARWLQPHIVLLDVGMATHLSPEDQHNMFNLFRAFARFDGRGLGYWTLQFSGGAQNCPDPEAFMSELEDYFRAVQESKEWEEMGISSGAESMAHVLEVVRKHQVSLPGHICAVVVTTLVLESWSNRLDPLHSPLHQVEALVAPESTPVGRRLTSAADAIVLRHPVLGDIFH